MPFYHAAGPNAAVGLLRAIAERAGFPTDSYHLNLDLATRLDEALHEALCRNHHNLMCEWLFAVAAFGEEADSDEAGYLSAYPEVLEVFGRLGRDRATVSQLRNDILPRFIDDCVGAADWGRYRVVAFTSTFQQNVASLALARRIKARWPAVAIVFGGSNMQGEAGEEYMRAFPFIDYVVTGDGDTAFPALLGAIASGTAPDGVPGLLFRSAGGIQRSAPAELFQDLDALPTPDYEEFFARAQRLGLLGQPKVGWMLPFEASRGCWWGARHQCTFCGFARDGIRYRSKTPARIFDELCELARKHAICTFSAADSIMDLRCVKGFFDKVHESRADFVFFWETKSNLTREQIATMHRGGLRQNPAGDREPEHERAAADEQGRHHAAERPLHEVGLLLRGGRRLEPPPGIPRRARRGLPPAARGAQAAQPPRSAQQLRAGVAGAILPVFREPRRAADHRPTTAVGTTGACTRERLPTTAWRSPSTPSSATPCRPGCMRRCSSGSRSGDGAARPHGRPFSSSGRRRAC